MRPRTIETRNISPYESVGECFSQVGIHERLNSAHVEQNLQHSTICRDQGVNTDAWFLEIKARYLSALLHGRKTETFSIDIGARCSPHKVQEMVQ